MTRRPQFAPEPAVAARAAAASAALSADSAAFRSDTGSGGPGFCTAAFIVKIGAAAPPVTILGGICVPELGESACATLNSAVPVSSRRSLRSTKNTTTPTYAPTSSSSTKRQGLGRPPSSDMGLILKCRQYVDDRYYFTATFQGHTATCATRP